MSGIGIPTVGNGAGFPAMRQSDQPTGNQYLKRREEKRNDTLDTNSHVLFVQRRVFSRPVYDKSRMRGCSKSCVIRARFSKHLLH